MDADDIKVSGDKPRLVQLTGGPDLTFEHVLALCEKMFGRPATEAEVEEMKRELDFLPSGRESADGKP
jgi:hypothetical protein